MSKPSQTRGLRPYTPPTLKPIKLTKAQACLLGVGTANEWTVDSIRSNPALWAEFEGLGGEVFQKSHAVAEAGEAEINKESENAGT